MAFSPDARLLLAVSRDRTWSLWRRNLPTPESPGEKGEGTNTGSTLKDCVIYLSGCCLPNTAQDEIIVRHGAFHINLASLKMCLSEFQDKETILEPYWQTTPAPLIQIN